MTFVKRTAAAAALIGHGLLTQPAHAAYIVTFTQQGNNVVATGSGSLDVTDLTFGGFIAAAGAITPLSADIATGPTVAQATAVAPGVTGPTTFGSGFQTLASSGSGDIVLLEGRAGVGQGELGVPAVYTSGDPLSDTSTYNNATFASLGAIPGTYVWTWGSGAHADSFTLQIGPATPTVPEPPSVLLLGTGLAAVLLLAGTIRRSFPKISN